MAKKRTNYKKSSRKETEKVSEHEQKSKELKMGNEAVVAKQLLSGDGKNPYYYGGITIQNFDDLQDHLKNFPENEVGWLADWIDYLGDNRTAVKIRESPSEFKTIINERYLELKKLMNNLQYR